MGHNLDLIEMYGLPKEVECPICKRKQESYHDDVDIECGNPIVNNKGKITITTSHSCEKCEAEYETTYEVSVKYLKTEEI